MTNVLEYGNLKREEAVNLANEINRLEAITKKMKDDLKSFVEQNGPVETQTEVWGYTEAVSYSFNGVQLKTVAENLVLDGHNPWELLSISASNLKKTGWNESYLETLGQKKITRRFGSKKK